MRLQREAQALAKLNHPNVVGVHDLRLHEGQVFVAMEFIDGQTLGDWMEERRSWRDVLESFSKAEQDHRARSRHSTSRETFRAIARVGVGRPGGLPVEPVID